MPAEIYNPAAYERGKEARIHANATKARNAKWLAEDERHEQIEEHVMYCYLNFDNPSSFIESLAGQLREWGSLSPKQVDAVWDKMVERRKERWDNAVLEAGSEWFGEPKQRIEMKLYPYDRHSYETQWGWVYITTYRTDDDNLVVYKGSALDDHGKDWLKVKATIKEHNTYRGAKQTVIQRPKMIEAWDYMYGLVDEFGDPKETDDEQH